MGKGQQRRAAAGGLSLAAIARIDEEKKMNAELRQALIEKDIEYEAKYTELKQRHKQSIESLLQSNESQRQKIKDYEDYKKSVSKFLPEYNEVLQKLENRHTILDEKFNKLKIVEQKNKLQAKKKDIELAKCKKELTTALANLQEQMHINDKKQKKIDKQEQLIGEMPETIKCRKLENTQKQCEEELKQTQMLQTDLEERSKSYAKLESIKMNLKRSQKNLQYHKEMSDEIEKRNDEMTTELEKKKDKLEKKFEQKEKEVVQKLKQKEKEVIQKLEQKEKEVTQELEQKEKEKDKIIEEITEEIDIFTEGKDDAIKSFRIKKGDLKYYYYVIDEHDENKQYFYEERYSETIKKVEDGKIDSLNIPYPNLNRNYLICLNAQGILVQINRDTGKERHILTKLVDIEQIKQQFPKIWNPPYDKINYIGIGTETHEYQKVLMFFKAGWNISHYPLPTEVKLIRVQQPWAWGKYKSAFSNYQQSNNIKPRHNWDPSLSHIDGEYLCWHGTTSDAYMSICEKGIKLYFSGSAGGAMFGLGSYGANQSSKSEQYSRRRPDSAGWKYMLLCGFNMGKTYKTTRTHENERKPPENYDSIYAEGGVARNKQQVHDEFIVFDSDQVVVYYILKYR